MDCRKCRLLGGAARKTMARFLVLAWSTAWIAAGEGIPPAVVERGTRSTQAAVDWPMVDLADDRIARMRWDGETYLGPDGQPAFQIDIALKIDKID